MVKMKTHSEIDPKAWELLTLDEQMALSLKHGHAKSTWQAGEIMSKAHYKFLEIEARAKFFLKMFMEYFDVYNELIPSFISMDNKFRTYLQITIGNRGTVREAVDFIDEKEYNSKQHREEAIIKSIERLVNSKELVDRNFVRMIFDFDRWNNFRILPEAIREPSAFKRRNKNQEKKNVKNLISLNEYQVQLILDRYQSLDTTKLIYMPIPSKDNLNKGYGVIQVRDTQPNIQDLSKFGFYLFYREADALEFYSLINQYSFNRKIEKNDCKLGQQFWPKFRELIKRSINENAIRKRIPSRKYLESAFRDGDAQFLKTKEKKVD